VFPIVHRSPAGTGGAFAAAAAPAEIDRIVSAAVSFSIHLFPIDFYWWSSH
jgi:hypothetical protein